MQLPADFTRQTRALMGDELFSHYLASFGEEPPVSIRLNPLKTAGWSVPEGERVPWCRSGYYLNRRPQFTFDPLLHAGCYYVQEAASMFLDEALRQHLPTRPVVALDMCAAPGGKSTLLRAALPAGSVLYSNEPVRQRAHVLAENMLKWGWPDCHITNSYPKDYARSRLRFDVILCDVPCSGEGMFRKDEATIGEWSVQKVAQCQALQRDIVASAWSCLADGGLLVYSTCTFNTQENEENIGWLLAEYDAEVLPVIVQPGWHITGSLLPGFALPVYRFIPGVSRGEGLFLCVVRKGGHKPAVYDPGTYHSGKPNDRVTKQKPPLSPVELPTLHAADAPRVELTYQQAVAYLRREALTLTPDAPRGVVEVCFLGQPLGTAKNIGSRANNLYPKEWKIKSTHTPTEYEAILRHS